MMRTNVKIVTCLALLFLLVAGSLPALAEQAIGDFRSKMEKWVETRQLISEERTEWQADRESLRSTQRLLKERKAALEADVAELEATSTVADDDRRDLLLKRAEYQRSAQVLKDRIREMEEAVLALAPQLPVPLQDKLEMLLVQIPDNPETTKLQLGQRLMNVLGVLAQAEKFNSTATFVGETRPLEDGQRVQVRTLYWGLGQAVYVDTPGRIAGIGRPGIDGWSFTNDESVAEEAKLLLDIYEGNVDTIEFVRLPIETDESL